MIKICNRCACIASSVVQVSLIRIKPMKTKLSFKFLLIALSIGTVDLGMSQERTFGNGDAALPRFLAVYDVDGDDVLNEEERQVARESRRERHQDRLTDWDTNVDGVLSNEEITAAREQVLLRIIATRCERFDEVDIDDIPGLSLAEFSNIPAFVGAERDRIISLFNRIKGDNDLISKEEFLALLAKRDRVAIVGGLQSKHPHAVDTGN
jgi:hypothetical protein